MHYRQNKYRHNVFDSARVIVLHWICCSICLLWRRGAFWKEYVTSGWVCYREQVVDTCGSEPQMLTFLITSTSLSSKDFLKKKSQFPSLSLQENLHGEGARGCPTIKFLLLICFEKWNLSRWISQHVIMVQIISINKRVKVVQMGIEKEMKRKNRRRRGQKAKQYRAWDENDDEQIPALLVL